MNEKIFPSIQILLSLAAATVYAVNRDVRRAFYWLAAAVIIAAVTF